jgi:hypothetical protein
MRACWFTAPCLCRKEEHIVFLVLGGWAVGLWGASKVFGGKKEEAPAAAAPTN